MDDQSGVCFLREIAVLKILAMGTDQLVESVIVFSSLASTVPDGGTGGALLAGDTNPN